MKDGGSMLLKERYEQKSDEGEKRIGYFRKRVY